MTVVKVKIQKDFTVLYNGVLENQRLSFKAKGLWAYCMSRSEDWHFHVNHLATVSKEGIDAVYSALKELEAEGLVVKSQKNEGGVFGQMDYIIYPYPQEIQKILPLRDFPYTEDSHPVNPGLVRTDCLPSTEKEVVCIPPPVGGGNQPSSLKKFTPEGKEVTISLQEIFSQAVSQKKNWTAEEIQKCWKILSDYKGFVRDPMAYFEGTIKNIRNQAKAEYLNKKHREEKCKSPEKNELGESKGNTLADDSKGRPSLGSLLEARERQRRETKKS